MEISSTFWLPDITDCWRQQETTHTKYPNLFNVGLDIICIIPHGVRAEPSFSLEQDGIGWRQSKPTGNTLRKQVVVMQNTRANDGLLAGDDPVLDSTSTGDDLEMKREAEQRMFHQMAKVYDVLEMWHGSQILCTTQMESHSPYELMTAIGYVKEIVKAFWSNFQHDGAAAFKLSERSPVPPALAAKIFPAG